MLFSELYSAYYNTVAALLRLAARGQLNEQRLQEVVSQKAFGESGLTIPAALKSEKWQLITKDFQTPLRAEPYMPLTELQKRWLKAISLDKRIQLFNVDFSALENVEPLFTPDDIYYFDRYEKGDGFTDEGYIRRFRILIKAVEERQPVKLELDNKRGGSMFVNVIPERLEYSEKEDKFRLLTSGCRYRQTVNLSSILHCAPYHGDNIKKNVKPVQKAEVTFLLFDGRNTLERAMLHFAHFEKQVEKKDDNHYTVRLIYEKNDETELLIRILSFGPFIKVLEPNAFVELIKNRLNNQKRCGI